MKQIMLGIILMFCCSGCLTTAPYWVRRSVVHDDWVVDQDEYILYRRYIPEGVFLRGNKVLLKKHPHIERRNRKIKVYPNYYEANSKLKQLQKPIIISPESRIYVPKSWPKGGKRKR